MIDLSNLKLGDQIRIRNFFEDEWFDVEMVELGGNVGYFNHKVGCYAETGKEDVIATRREP